MKKILIFVVVAAGLLYGVYYFATGGRMEAYLDGHPNPTLNPKIEYFIATLVNLAGKSQSAENRYRRIVEKYPDSGNVPEAWAEMIELIDARNDKNLVLQECQKFLEIYPGHPKAEIIKRKIAVIQHGY